MSNSFLVSLTANTDASIARLVKRRLPDIEAALAAGFTHREILAQLNRDGIKLTEKYYRRLIPRLRNQVAIETTTTRPLQSPAKAARTKPNLAETESGLGIKANSPDFHVGLATAPVDQTSIISAQGSAPIPFVWDPHAAKNFSIDKL
jgi:hypothetical protein